MKTLDDDPADQVRQAVADARAVFAADVDALLGEVRAFVDTLEADAFARRTRYEAWCELRRVFLQKFEQRSPMRNLEATMLRQLVREAYDALNNPETRVDIRSWTKSAEPFVRS